jgi:pimeloyl-ACP methyl ester carboxylesterase
VSPGRERPERPGNRKRMPPDPIVILPGFLLTPGGFREMQAALRLFGDVPSRVVPTTIGDWAASVSAAGWARILAKLERTVQDVLMEAGAEKVVLVGHSAGGVMGRLFLNPEPFRGHAYDGKKAVRGLITLGSPHQARRGSPMRLRVQALYPGARFSPEVKYLSVAGKAVRGDRKGVIREKASYRGYQALCGNGEVWGDGVVPVDSAWLEGSRPLVLEGVHHFGLKDRRWYGSADVVKEWWTAWLEFAAGPAISGTPW